MDPLSVIASTVALTEATLKTIRLIQRVWSTAADVREVVEVLEKFRLVFSQAGEAVAKPHVWSNLSAQSKEAVSSIAASAKVEIDRLYLLLNEKIISPGPSGGDARVHYAAWLRHGSSIKKICDKLQDLQSNLSLVSGAIIV